MVFSEKVYMINNVNVLKAYIDHIYYYVDLQQDFEDTFHKKHTIYELIFRFTYCEINVCYFINLINRYSIKHKKGYGWK